MIFKINIYNKPLLTPPSLCSGQALIRGTLIYSIPNIILNSKFIIQNSHYLYLIPNTFPIPFSILFIPLPFIFYL